MGGVGKAYQVIRRACRRQGAAVEVSRQETRNRGRLLEADRTGRRSGKHGIAVKGTGLRAGKAMARENVDGVGVRVGPHAEFWIVREVRSEVILLRKYLQAVRASGSKVTLWPRRSSRLTKDRRMRFTSMRSK